MRAYLVSAGLQCTTLTRVASVLGLCFLVAGCKTETNYFCVSEGPVEEQGCFLCRDGACSEQPIPERPTCSEPAACGPSTVCTNIGCVQQCDDEIDCPFGTTCAPSGLCLNPTEGEPTLVEAPEAPEPPAPLPQVGFCPATPCAPGRVCRTGVCRTPCETDEQCERADPAIRFCRNVSGENLCVRASEILSGCELDVDCGEGGQCVDGSCAP